MTAATPANRAVSLPAARRPAQSLALRWTALLLLSLGALISFVDRTNISAALADKAFIRAFAMTDVDRGTVNSLFFWSYGLIQMPMGWLVDRYGVKWPYAISFLLWCLATMLTGMIATFAVLLLMRLVIGATEGIVMPGSYRWIRDNFEESRRGTAVGIFTTGGKFGPALGAPIAAWLIIHYDWRTMFYVTGGIGLCWLLPWLLVARNDMPRRQEMAAIRRRASTVTLGSVMRSPLIWGAMINAFCYGYFTFYCMTWMPAYLAEKRGLSLQESGIFTFFSFAGIALVGLAAGWVADRMIARGGDAVFIRKSFVVAGFLGGCTVLFGAYARSIDVALFWNVASLSLLGLAAANNVALTRLTLIPAPAVGLATGVQQVAGSLSGGISASLSGWLLHESGGYDLPIAVISVFLVIGVLATIFLLQPKWAPQVYDDKPRPT